MGYGITWLTMNLTIIIRCSLSINPETGFTKILYKDKAQKLPNHKVGNFIFLSLRGTFISFPIKLKHVWYLVHNICQIIPEISQLPVSSRNLYVMEETRFHTYNGEGEWRACGATLNLYQPHCVK